MTVLFISSFFILVTTANALRLMHMNTAVSSAYYSSPVTVLGAGPCGLATAIMLARRGYKDIRVFERLDEPLPPDSIEWVDFTRERSYNIGLSGRGQRALRELGVMGTIEEYSADVIGRKDWSPESKVDAPLERVYTTKSYTTRVIQRDRLASVLLSVLRTHPDYSKAVKVQFNTKCTKVDFASESAFLHLADKNSIGDLVLESKFVIGCDGTASALRDAMEASSKGTMSVRRYEDKNVRVYRTIPLHFPPNDKNWNSQLNFSARTKSDINIDALPTKGGPMLGVVLYRPWDTRVTGLKNKEDARSFFREVLPMFDAVVKDDDLERFAKKECSKLPRFTYTGPVLHHEKTACVVMGDAIHTVKPYFGLGVNSAFEDVMALDQSLAKSKDDVPSALREFSKLRAPEARAMVEISERLDGGFLAFVLPLIVDSIFHKKFPKLFAPPMLTILQNEKLSFRYIQLRKRLDRLMQFSLLFSILAGMVKSVGFLSRIGGRKFAVF